MHRSTALLASVAILVLAVRSEATPVTFEFEARISSIVEGSEGGAGVPLAIGDGDLLTGRFTFELPGLSQSLRLELRLGDLVLSSDSYVFFVYDDANVSFNYDSSLHMNEFITGHFPNPRDAQGLSCLPCGVVPGHPEVEWRLLLDLQDPEQEVLDDASLTTDLETWNGYPFQNLTIALVRGQRVFTTLHSQEVGQFSAAPEPRLQVWMMSAAALGLALIARRRRDLPHAR